MVGEDRQGRARCYWVMLKLELHIETGVEHTVEFHVGVVVSIEK